VFLTRVLTVLVALPIFAAALILLPEWLWALFLVPILVIAGWEWAGLAAYGRIARVGYGLALGITALAIYYFAPAGDTNAKGELWLYGSSFAFWSLVAPFWLRGHWEIRNPLALGCVGFILLVPMWLALVRLQAAPWLLLLFMSIVWIADTAAYLAGRKWGRRKLAPRISPGKSWEGVLGAAAALAVYYALLWLFVPVAERPFAAVPGLVVFAALLALSIEGDLFESWMKRVAGVKDSSHLLPGHGGILDRVDGLTSTMPAAVLALHLFT
jgi:phosphatidate cytidylyltransferase